MRELPFRKLLYITLWVLLVGILLWHMSFELNGILFAISTLFLLSHIVYAGYYIFSKSRIYNAPLVILAVGIFTGLCSLAVLSGNPVQWFISLIGVFVLAAFFHLYFKSHIHQIYLQEFCNYKVFIEIYGILLSFIGIALYLLLPHSWLPLIGILNLIAIIRLNYLIFMKKRLYRLEYEDVAIPDQPLVSIVVIAYNEEQYIGKCLSSIAEQTYKNFEVIVVDDHSVDKTVEIAKGFSGKLPLQIVQKEVRGCSRSRNYGASFAKGEIILFLDADVILPPHFLEEGITSFTEQNLAIAGIDFIPITYHRFDHFYTKFYRTWLNTVQYFNPRGIGFCMMVARDHHHKILFDETVTMCEDFDYVRRASQQGKFRILKNPKLHVSWRRFDHENRYKLLVKYLYFEWYRQNIGEIRKKKVAYTFGHYNKDVIHDILDR